MSFILDALRKSDQQRQRGAAPTLLTAQAAVFVPLTTGFARIAEGRIRPTRQMLRHGLVAGAILAAALMLLLEGLARGPASVLVPIAQMGFVVTAAAGFRRSRSSGDDAAPPSSAAPTVCQERFSSSM